MLGTTGLICIVNIDINIDGYVGNLERNFHLLKTIAKRVVFRIEI